jgi:hypothetical protein
VLGGEAALPDRLTLDRPRRSQFDGVLEARLLDRLGVIRWKAPMRRSEPTAGLASEGVRFLRRCNWSTDQTSTVARSTW